MVQPNFYIVDVFAEEKYAGNQLAVFRNVGSLSDESMQKIAGEMNYSETTYILSDDERNGGFDVRIFTPKAEVPFAGHPTLGTAYVILNEIMRGSAGSVTLNLKVGQIPVTVDTRTGSAGVLWMKQMPPRFGQVFDPGVVAEVLQLGEKDIDTQFPIQQVSTGIPFIIAPLRNLDALKRARTVRDKYIELIADLEAKAILVFCPEPYHDGNDLSVRVFADYYGVAEDPATGSANGCLAGYLVKHRYFGKDKIDIRVEQGVEIGRPSLLLLKAKESAGTIEVSVGGRVIAVAQGRLI